MAMLLERQVLAMQLKSSRKYTILVSGASGIVGYGILKSLKELNCKLIGTTIYDMSPANCFSDIVQKPPLSNDDSYLEWLLNTITQYSVDMIIPGIELDMNIWNKNRKELEETGTIVLLNNENLIDLCLDKWKFYQKLTEYGFKYSIQSSIEPDFKQFKIPFILKPRCGYGSQGLIKVYSKEIYEQYKHEIGKTLMMQELVGVDEEEYTVSAFFDKESTLKAYIAMKRKLSKLGYTEIAEVVFLEDIKKIILELADMFKPIGPTNFQFRKHNGKWKLLEINPRISSSTSIRRALGYNESRMSFEYFVQGKEIVQPQIRNGKAIRYTEDYIIYDSDNI